MIIAGNSHVSMFRQGMIRSGESRPVGIHWVGPLTVEHFFNSHPAARRVRTVFDQHQGWCFLSIGLHDHIILRRIRDEELYRETLNRIREQYKKLFKELHTRAKGNFGWLTGPQRLRGIEFTGVDEKKIDRCTDDFIRFIADWCVENGVVVINPLEKILDGGYPAPEYLQADQIHLNADALHFYLEEIKAKTGEPLCYKPLQQSSGHRVEPRDHLQSFTLLAADELDLPWDQTPFPHGTLGEFERSISRFIRQRLEERGLNVELKRDTDFIGGGLLDSLELVDIYTYATELFGADIDFNTQLRELNTIEKICFFFFQGKPLSKNDFFHSTAEETRKPRFDWELLYTDFRIGRMEESSYSRLREIVQLQSADGEYHYGVAFFWYALVEARRENYSAALDWLTKASDNRLTYPFVAPRREFYRKQWGKKLEAVPISSELPGTRKSAEVATGFVNSFQLPVNENMLITKENSADSDSQHHIDELIEILYRQGVKLTERAIDGKSFSDAEITLKKLILMAPAHAKAHVQLGHLYWSRRRETAALKYLHKAVTLDPENKDTVFLLADVYISVGKHPEAVKILRAYLYNCPDDVENKERLQKLEKASDAFQKGAGLSRQKRFLEAAHAFQEAARLLHNSPVSWNNLGTALFMSGDIQPALDAFKRGLEVFPNHSDTAAALSPVIDFFFQSKRRMDAYLSYGRRKEDFLTITTRRVVEEQCLARYTYPVPDTRLIKMWRSGRAVTSDHELLLELKRKPVAANIKTICVVGAHSFKEKELLYHVFPGLERIYLFEPIPAVFSSLKKTVAGDKNMKVFPYAISDNDGEARFHIADNEVSSSLLPMGEHRRLYPHVNTTGTITVQCRTLDRVIKSHRLKMPDMVFIDAQGAEYRILSALSPRLRSGIRLIYSEVSKRELYQGGKLLEDVCALLRPDFFFEGFAPLSNNMPCHGNSVFVHQRHKDDVPLFSSETAWPQPLSGDETENIETAYRLYRDGEKSRDRDAGNHGLSNLLQCLEAVPFHAKINNNAGVLFWKKGEVERAGEYFQKAVSIDPDDGGIVFNWGAFLEFTGRYGDARFLFERFLSRHPGHKEVEQRLEALKKKPAQVPPEVKPFPMPWKRDALVQEFVFYLLSNHKDVYAAACMYLGDRAKERGDNGWPDFYREWTRLMEGKENLPPLRLYRLASLCKQTGDIEDAEAFFLMLLKRANSGNMHSGAYFHLGEIAYRRQEVKRAASYFRKCLRLNPGHRKAGDYLVEIKKKQP